MKTRIDFVSNSSSSSFVFAVNKCYALKDLCKDIAASTISPEDEYHDDNLEQSNFTKLMFCLSSYQLAWLGSLSIGTHRVVESKRELFDVYDWMTKEDIDADWKRKVQRAKLAKTSPDKVDLWTLKMYKNAEIDDVHDEITYDEDILVDAPAVLNSTMEDVFFNASWHSKKTSSKRAAKIVEFAKTRWMTNTFDRVDMFQITKSTVQNTRSLIDAGYSIDFSTFPISKSLEQIERILDTGSKIFCIRVAYSGDGYGDTYIYCEDGANGLSDVCGIEIFGGECM